MDLHQGPQRAIADSHDVIEVRGARENNLAGFVRDLETPSVGPLVSTLRTTLDSLVEIGLGYLSLDRESGTLSGGEAQRVKMVRPRRQHRLCATAPATGGPGSRWAATDRREDRQKR